MSFATRFSTGQIVIPTWWKVEKKEKKYVNKFLVLSTSNSFSGLGQKGQ